MQHIRHYFSLHVSTRHTFCFYIIYLELWFDNIYVAVLSYLKVSLPKKKFDIFFIALLKYSNFYEYFDVKMTAISEHKKWTNFPPKTGFHVRNFSAPCFGLWRHKYDTTLLARHVFSCCGQPQQENTWRASEGRQIFRLFSTFLVILFYDIAKLTYLKALRIESDHDTPNNCFNLWQFIKLIWVKASLGFRLAAEKFGKFYTDYI